MPSRPDAPQRISQREAKRLRKRVQALESIIATQRRIWSQEYFGGVNIANVAFNADHQVVVATRTARKLGHAVVVIGDESGNLRFMALPHPKEGI